MPLRVIKLAKNRKVILVLFICTLLGFIYMSVPGELLTIAKIKSEQHLLERYYLERPVVTAMVFVSTYITLASLSLPVTAIFSIVGGAIFGFTRGVCLVSIASSTAAVIAFTISRYLFRDYIQRRFADHLRPINEGMLRDGPLYLFIMRMVPVFPYFIVNVALAMTPVRTLTFYLVSLVGMLPVTVMFVNAGMQLSTINTLADVFSARVLLSLSLIALLPLLVKKSVVLLRENGAGTG